MIAKRYRNDGKAVWAMNSVQEQEKQKVLGKIEADIYRLEIPEKCLCGSIDAEQITEKDRFGLPIGAAICRTCGLISSSPRFVEEVLPDFYNNEYHRLCFGTEVRVNLTKADQGAYIYRFVVPFLKGRKNITIFEIGAGSGAVLAKFREMAWKDGFSVSEFGCEYSESYVDFGISQGINLIQGGTEVLRKIQQKADLVILSHVFEHFYNPIAELEIIKGLISPKGLLYVEVPGIFRLQSDWSTAYDCDYLKYRICAHIYDFTLDTLKFVLALGGFELVSGNEFCRAIFSLSDAAKPVVPGDTYVKTMKFLKDLERNRYSNYAKNAICHPYLYLRKAVSALERNIMGALG